MSIVADAEARRKSCLTYDRHIVLEAGAGTGKTAILVARVVCWCIGPGWVRSRTALSQPAGHLAVPSNNDIAQRVLSRMVAVTFTEKASAEMSERIGAALRALSVGGQLADVLLLKDIDDVAMDFVDGHNVSERAGALLLSLQHLFVGTIHAFCRQILAAHALETEFSTGIEIDATGVIIQRLCEDVIAEQMDTLYGDPGDAVAMRLANRGYGPQQVLHSLSVMARASVDVVGLDRSVDDAAIFDQFKQQVCATLQFLSHRLAAEFSDSKSIAKDAQYFAEAFGKASTALDEHQIGDAIPIDLIEKTKKHVEADPSVGEQKNNVLDALQLLLGQLRQLSVRHQNYHRNGESNLLDDARLMLGRLLRQVQLRQAEQGVISFDGLIKKTCELLARHKYIGAQYRQSLDQLLVDEFQDTDDAQCALLSAIVYAQADTKFDDRQKNDDKLILFVVGDPKQSIYAWRSADLRAYERFVSELTATEAGELLYLTVNFRSVPAILEEVDRVMSHQMRPIAGIQPAFRSLVPPPIEGDQSWSPLCPVAYWTVDPVDAAGKKITAAQVCEIEAEHLVADLLRIKQVYNVPWGRIAILMRASTIQEHYVRALQYGNIPYAVQRDRVFFRRREVIDAASWVRAVLDPHDEVALIGCLRSVAVGVVDAAWLPLRQRGFFEKVSRLTDLTLDDSGLIAELDTDVNAVAVMLTRAIGRASGVELWPASLKFALRQIAKLRGSLSTVSIDRWVLQLRHALLHQQTEAARFLGKHRVRYLDRFYQQVLTMLSDPALGVFGTLDYLRRATSTLSEPEVLGSKTYQDDAVQLLTIHQSKGLTFDCVYVVGLHTEPAANKYPDTEVLTDGDVFSLRIGGVPSLRYILGHSYRRQVERAETLRTLYVAMTRPKFRLVLSGRWPVDSADWSNALALVTFLPWQGDTAKAGSGDSTVQWKTIARGAGAAASDGCPSVPPAAQHLDMHALRSAASVVWANRVEAGVYRQKRSFLTAMSATNTAVAYDNVTADHPATNLPVAALRSIGTVIHRILQEWDFSMDESAELARLAARLPSYCPPALDADLRQATVEYCGRWLHALPTHQLFQRLKVPSRKIIARELPVGMLTDSGNAAIGTIDLLCWDEVDNQFVVIDHKTSQVSPGDLDVHVQRYIRQMTSYVTVLQKMFDRSAASALITGELWFWSIDRVVPLALVGESMIKS